MSLLPKTVRNAPQIPPKEVVGKLVSNRLAHHVDNNNLILQRSFEVSFICVRKPISLKFNVVSGDSTVQCKGGSSMTKRVSRVLGAVKPALLKQPFEFGSKCSIS